MISTYHLKCLAERQLLLDTNATNSVIAAAQASIREAKADMTDALDTVAQLQAELAQAEAESRALNDRRNFLEDDIRKLQAKRSECVRFQFIVVCTGTHIVTAVLFVLISA